MTELNSYAETQQDSRSNMSSCPTVAILRMWGFSRRRIPLSPWRDLPIPMASPSPVCPLDRLLLCLDECGDRAHPVLDIIRAGADPMEGNDAIVDDDPDLGSRGRCAGED